MHNNDVTYDKKWDTKKNEQYKKMAQKIASKSKCGSRIPASWARETYFFLHQIETKFGIAYPTNTMDGYYLPKGLEWFKELFYFPIRKLPGLIRSLCKDMYSKPSKYAPKTKLGRVKETIWGYGRGGYLYGWRALCYKLYATYFNYRYRPQVLLRQFKEKFGYVTVYYNASDDVKVKVDKYIENLEKSLIKKGVYHSVTRLVKERNKI